MKKSKMLVSFSGGLTSAYMSWWLKENKSKEYDLVFVYANTGQEHESTLKFINQCDLYFGLNLIWIEAVVSQEKGVGTTYKIATYESCSKNGEPFEDVIKVYGIPNVDYKHCNRELKIQPINSFMRDNGIFYRSIGIREDEFSRATESTKKKFPYMNVNEILEYRFKNEGIYYPLIKDRHTTKDEVKFWWSKMPFTLDIEEHYGNCVTCWKKSDRKLWTIAKENPHHFYFFKTMELKYSSYIPIGQENSRTDRNVFYRKYRSAEDIIKEANENNFIPFSPNEKLQLSLFNCEVDEEFSCNECGTIF